jgi:hypothetical protein
MENDDNFGLDPGAFYRWSQGFDLFGLKPTQLSEAMNTGKLPTTTQSIKGGKAKGWFGFQIIGHRRAQFDAAERLAATDKKRDVVARAKQRALKHKQPAPAE